MKLLLDHNISHKLVSKLRDVYPDSTQTRLLGFGRTGDSELWFYARTHGYVFVTKDRDVAEIAVLRGAPPKVVWLRTGNCSAAFVEPHFVEIRKRSADSLLTLTRSSWSSPNETAWLTDWRIVAAAP